MRSFTLVSDTSSKFWEVERRGSEVTVRFGRIGTNGQTQVKDLGTETAAIAHVDKLVLEKTAKGYVETETAGDSAAASVAGLSGPAVEEEPAEAPASAPAVETPAAPAAAGVEVLDEDRWEVPASWWRQAEPFRGLQPLKPVALDPEAPAKIAQQLALTGERLSASLDHPHADPELRSAARRHLGGERKLFRAARPEPSPLGAAVIAAVVAAAVGWEHRGKWAELTEAWVIEHGLPFAVQAAMQLSTVSVGDPNRYHLKLGEAVVRVDGHEHWQIPEVLERLRVILVAVDDAAYAQARAAAAALRGEGIGQRLTSSYLFPTEQTWVTQDIEELTPGQCGSLAARLFASVTTKEQVAKLTRATERQLYVLNRHSSFLWSAVVQVGPDVEPLLIKLYDAPGEASDRKRLLSILAQLPTDSAFQQLVERLGEKFVGAVALEAMNRFPARAMRLLGVAAAKTRSGPAKELLRGHVINYPHLVESTTALQPQVASVLASIAKTTAPVERIANDEVPPLLASPPWLSRKKKTKPVVLEGLVSSSTLKLVWKPGEKEQWASLPAGWTGRHEPTPWEQHIDAVIRPGGQSWWQVSTFAAAPEHLVRPLLRRPDLLPDSTWDAESSLKLILAKYGEEAAAYVARVALKWPSTVVAALLPLEGSDIAPAVANWFVRSKSLRQFALSWLARHPEAAARDLIPPALGKSGRDRTAAEAVLRHLDPEVVRTAAQAYGVDAVAGVEAVLALDPLDILPVKMPAVPGWLDPGHLPPILVGEPRGALPVEAATNVVLMLMVCRPGEPYAGVAMVKEACEPASLAQFAWAIFERWRAADYPAKDSWVLEGLGLLGDDDVVRELAPLIGAWPGESAHARAVAALDVLSNIGSDVALMHLHRISEKVTYKSVKTKAKEKMTEVAEGLGLTPEQLADRLVPDLGLDGDGTMVLDYGPRQFTVGFDEQLKPVVLDPDGSRRKVLPKPSARDDEVLATAAYAQFSGLKKDVKTIAQDQIRRLERAMVTSRRWTGAEHRELFVEHPLVWHLARRLVWAIFNDDGNAVGSFRIAEDRSMADSADDEATVTDNAVVGIAHPLHLDVATLRAWSDTLSDYEILQPFQQVGREVFALTDAERQAATLDRFHQAVAPTGRVLGMTHKGWERGTPGDAGIQFETFREIGAGRYIVIELDPGIPAGAAMEWPEQKLTKVWLSASRPEWGGSEGTLTFGVLDDVAASEVVRDLEALVIPA